MLMYHEVKTVILPFLMEENIVYFIPSVERCPGFQSRCFLAHFAVMTPSLILEISLQHSGFSVYKIKCLSLISEVSSDSKSVCVDLIINIENVHFF